MYNKERAGGNSLRQVPRLVMLREWWGDKCRAGHTGSVKVRPHLLFLNARRDGIQEGALYDQEDLRQDRARRSELSGL